MASAWGTSWGLSWGNSWGQIQTPSGSSGGDFRTLPPLSDFKKRVKDALDKEQAELLKEAKHLKKRLIEIETERLLGAKKEEIRQKQEIELKLLLVSESLLQVEKDLTEIALKRASIDLRAQIMRDDEEVLILLLI